MMRFALICATALSALACDPIIFDDSFPPPPGTPTACWASVGGGLVAETPICDWAIRPNPVQPHVGRVFCGTSGLLAYEYSASSVTFDGEARPCGGDGSCTVPSMADGVAARVVLNLSAQNTGPQACNLQATYDVDIPAVWQFEDEVYNACRFEALTALTDDAMPLARYMEVNPRGEVRPTSSFVSCIERALETHVFRTQQRPR